MQAFAGFIIFVSFIVFILGVVNVIRPQAWMKVRKRLIGAFIILGSMAGCVGGSIMSVSAEPGGWAAAMEAGREAREAEEAKAAQEKQAKPEVAETADAAKLPTAAPRTHGLTQAEFDGIWTGVKSQMERCDAPVRRAGEVVGTGNAYAAFRPVKAASEACRDAWLGIDRIEIPRSAKGEVKKALREARERCSTAAVVKKEAMDRMAKVLDGDDKPSTMAALQDSLKRGTDLSSGCWLGFLAAATEAGLEMPEFKDAD